MASACRRVEPHPLPFSLSKESYQEAAAALPLAPSSTGATTGTIPYHSSPCSSFLKFLADVLILFCLSFTITAGVLVLYIFLCIFLPSPISLAWCHSRCSSLSGGTEVQDCRGEIPWISSCGILTSMGHYVFVLLVLHPGSFLTCSYAYKEIYPRRNAQPGALRRLVWWTVVVTIASSVLYTLQVRVIGSIGFYPGQIGYVALLLIVHYDKAAGGWSRSQYFTEIGTQMIPTLAVIGSLNFLFPLLFQHLSFSLRRITVGYVLPACFFLLSIATKRCLARLQERSSSRASATAPGNDRKLSYPFPSALLAVAPGAIVTKIKKIIPASAVGLSNRQELGEPAGGLRREEREQCSALMGPNRGEECRERSAATPAAGTTVREEEPGQASLEQRHHRKGREAAAGHMSAVPEHTSSSKPSEMKEKQQLMERDGQEREAVINEDGHLKSGSKAAHLVGDSHNNEVVGGRVDDQRRQESARVLQKGLESSTTSTESISGDPILFMLYLTLQSIQVCASISNAQELNALQLIATSTGSSCLNFIATITFRIFKARLSLSNAHAKKRRETRAALRREKEERERASTKETQEEVTTIAKKVVMVGSASISTPFAGDEPPKREEMNVFASQHREEEAKMAPRMSTILTSFRDSLTLLSSSSLDNNEELKARVTSWRRMAMNMTIATVCSIAVLVVTLLCRNFVRSRMLRHGTCYTGLGDASLETGDSESLLLQISVSGFWASMDPRIDYVQYVVVVLVLVLAFVGILELMGLHFLYTWSRERRMHFQNAILFQIFMSPFLTTSLLFALISPAMC